eukprot:SAG31_NODE_591_length_13740_cov_11.032256_6_plen_158_part_00
MTARLVGDLQERRQTASPEDLVSISQNISKISQNTSISEHLKTSQVPQLYPTADGTADVKRSALMPDQQQLEAAQKKVWEGISPEEAKARQAKYGPNKLPVGACMRLLPVCPRCAFGCTDAHRSAPTAPVPGRAGRPAAAARAEAPALAFILISIIS